MRLCVCAGVPVTAIEAALTEIAMIAMVRISFFASTIPIRACRRRLVKQAFLEFLQPGRSSQVISAFFFYFFLWINKTNALMPQFSIWISIFMTSNQKTPQNDSSDHLHWRNGCPHSPDRSKRPCFHVFALVG